MNGDCEGESHLDDIPVVLQRSCGVSSLSDYHVKGIMCSQLTSCRLFAVSDYRNSIVIGMT